MCITNMLKWLFIHLCTLGLKQLRVRVKFYRHNCTVCAFMEWRPVQNSITPWAKSILPEWEIAVLLFLYGCTVFSCNAPFPIARNDLVPIWKVSSNYQQLTHFLSQGETSADQSTKRSNDKKISADLASMHFWGKGTQF